MPEAPILVANTSMHTEVYSLYVHLNFVAAKLWNNRALLVNRYKSRKKTLQDCLLTKYFPLTTIGVSWYISKGRICLKERVQDWLIGDERILGCNAVLLGEIPTGG